MYMQERIEALRRDIDKHGKVKVKKGQQAPPAVKVKTLRSLQQCHSNMCSSSIFVIASCMIMVICFASQDCTARLCIALHSAAQRSTAQHSTAQHSTATAQHSTAQHSTAQHSTAQHSTAQHSTAQHSTAQHSLAMAACSCCLPQYHWVAGSEHFCDAAQVVHADLFVSDRFTGWRERVLINLSQLYSQQTQGFPADVSQQMVARASP